MSERQDWYVAQANTWRCDGTWKVTNQVSYAFPFDYAVGLTRERAEQMARELNLAYPTRNAPKKV